MAKKKEEVIIDVEEGYSKLEQYINQNQKSLTIIFGGVVLIIAIYLGWTNFYLAPLEEEAKEEVWKAQEYFGLDSFQLALNGDGQYMGFLEIIDNYGATSTANLAQYYAGVSFLRLGNYPAALELLGDFHSNDILVSAMAKGAMGDAYSQMGNIDGAIDQYLDAANHKENDYTSPLFLRKAALHYESLNEYGKALEMYERIKAEYPESQEALTVEKYMARAKAYQ